MKYVLIFSVFAVVLVVVKRYYDRVISGMVDDSRPDDRQLDKLPMLGFRAVPLPYMYFPVPVASIDACYQSSNCRHTIITVRHAKEVWWNDRKKGVDWRVMTNYGHAVDYAMIAGK